ncbi:MAG: tRNA (adenosine(37)-N6)-threonylcarbamoyltransferase complex transferase subunit TsaD [Deltaproteobacteria bacterium]|nr:tRNA (adenosine(37)-N6)-threonylcarbamoyltransferase complex transferase subunit TsaD [Deltaproteobacteria bacterium]
MLILGIESSCDDTAASVVEDGRRVLSTIVASQDDIHGRYGGIVPELASRSHIEAVIPVVEGALEKAGVSLGSIDGVSVTQGPGLVGSILVGLSFAKAISFAANLPLTAVNHIESHPHAAFLYEGEEKDAPRFPFVALVVSGGHTTLLLMEGPTGYRVLGQTLDDAAGEAFDKVAKLMGLGYPGGAAIDALARQSDPGKVAFSRPYIAKGSLDFSFSGIKTAVLNHVRGLSLKDGEVIPEATIRDISAGFQGAVVDVLVDKAFWAAKRHGVGEIVVAGGVACNSRLRQRFEERARQEGVRLFIPPPRFCSDNGAMVAALGYHQLKKGMIAPLDLNARPTWDGF